MSPTTRSPTSSLTPRVPSSTLLRHRTRTWMTLRSASYSLKYTENTPITAVRKVCLSVRRQCLSRPIEQGNPWKRATSISFVLVSETRAVLKISFLQSLKLKEWSIERGNLWKKSLALLRSEKALQSLAEMWELRKFQSSTFDTMARRKLIEDQNTILELSGRVQELQNEVNCMNDSKDFQDAESVRSGNSHVTSRPVSFPPHPIPAGMLRPSFVSPSRREGPPSIWDTHGISGNVFADSHASSSAPYPQELNEWNSSIEEPLHSSTVGKSDRPERNQDLRCQSGPSAKDSVIFSGGDFSKNYGADQQRLQISDLHFDKFLTPATFACWKIRFKTEVCTCLQFPTEAMQWIKEVELVDSVDELRSSSSTRGISMPNFQVLDARIASALNKIIQNSQFKRRIRLEEQKAQKEDRFNEAHTELRRHQQQGEIYFEEERRQHQHKHQRYLSISMQFIDTGLKLRMKADANKLPEGKRLKNFRGKLSQSHLDGAHHQTFHFFCRRVGANSAESTNILNSNKYEFCIWNCSKAYNTLKTCIELRHMLNESGATLTVGKFLIPLQLSDIRLSPRSIRRAASLAT